MVKGVRFTVEELEKAGFSFSGGRAQRKRQVKDVNRAAAQSASAIRDDVDRNLVEQIATKQNKHVLRLEQQLTAFPPHVKEFFAIPGRNFQLDYAWPAVKVGIEVQGVHHREKGKFGRDIEKRALHLVAGWRVLELDGKAIKEERSVEWLRALLG